jgi:hypothetical protein
VILIIQLKLMPALSCVIIAARKATFSPSPKLFLRTVAAWLRRSKTNLSFYGKRSRCVPLHTFEI